MAPAPCIPGWVLGRNFGSPASLDYDIADGRWWQQGRPGCTGPTSCLTVSRASTEYQADLSGLLHLFASGVAAITNAGIGSWQAATNETLYSRDLTQAAWVASNITAAHTAIGADGTANGGSLLTATASNGTILQTFTVISEAQNHSIYVQRVAGTGEIDITENNGVSWTALTSSNCVQPGTLVASGLVTNGYVRCSVEATLANPVIGFRIVSNGDAVNVDFDQLENNTFPTPPIPTTNAALARAADVVTVETPPTFGSAYTLYASGTPEAPTGYNFAQGLASVNDGTNSNRFSLYRNGGNGLAVMISSNSGVNTPVGGFVVFKQGSFGKIAGSSKASSQVFVANGSVQGSSSVAAPSVSALNIGSRDVGASFFNGTISRIALWPTIALSSAQLQQITSGGGP